MSNDYDNDKNYIHSYNYSNLFGWYYDESFVYHEAFRIELDDFDVKFLRFSTRNF